MAAAVVVALCAGCQSAGEPDDDARAKPEPTAEPAVVPTAGARTTLRRGLRIISREPVTAFRATVNVDGVLVQDTVGVVSIEGWPASAAGCWLALPPGQTFRELPALQPREPAYLSVVANATAVDFVDEGRSSIRAEIPLEIAAAILPAAFLEVVGPELPTAVPVPVLLDLDDEQRIGDFVVRGDDVLAALEEVDARPTGVLAVALRTLRIAVAFPGTEQSGAIATPPRDKQFAQGSDGCN